MKMFLTKFVQNSSNRICSSKINYLDCDATKLALNIMQIYQKYQKYHQKSIIPATLQEMDGNNSTKMNNYLINIP